MTEQYPYKSYGASITITGEGGKQPLFSHPKTLQDEINKGRQYKHRWLPEFIKHRLWPIQYEQLSFQELAEKKKLRFHEVMNRAMFGVVAENPQCTTYEGIDARKVEADQTLPPVDADIQALRERVSVCIADVACNGESVVTLTHHIDNLVTASAERIKELEKEIEELKADMEGSDETKGRRKKS